jgi:hypothetical protein
MRCLIGHLDPIRSGPAKLIKAITELGTASRGKWTSVYATSGSNLQSTTYLCLVLLSRAVHLL